MQAVYIERSNSFKMQTSFQEVQVYVHTWNKAILIL